MLDLPNDCGKCSNVAPPEAKNIRIAATDCTKIVLICHERDLFCRLHGRVQILDLRMVCESMQAKITFLTHNHENCQL